jgi:hypothetical protein
MARSGNPFYWLAKKMMALTSAASKKMEAHSPARSARQKKF